MTIKKTILGFMATALLMGAAVCQAETLTVRKYNHAKDKNAVRALIKEHLNIFVNDAVLLKGRTQNEKNDIIKNRKEFATDLMNEDGLFLFLELKDLDGAHFSHLVLESKDGIKGFVCFAVQDCDCGNNGNYDCNDNELIFWHVFLKKGYIKHTIFQKVLNYIRTNTKNLHELSSYHTEFAYSNEYKTMFKKCGFNLQYSDKDRDGLDQTLNTYKLILK